MQAMGWVVLFIGMAVTGFCLLQLWKYRRQTEHIISELSILNGEDTNHRVSSFCRAGKTEALIEQINALNDRHMRLQRALKRENRIYKESITGISHDIRTPLTSAKGYVQMLGQCDESKRAEYIAKADQRLDDVNAMLNQLFEYARIEAGELPMEWEKINAVNVFADVIARFYGDFVSRNCRPQVEVPDGPCYVMGDRQALVRIIENLMKNALVHGTGEYRLSLRRQANQLQLCIANRTDSIEPGDVDRLFDRFYTTDQSRSRKTTGLGLAIVKQFALQMGGGVEAALNGQDFCVTVHWPLVGEQAPKNKEDTA